MELRSTVSVFLSIARRSEGQMQDNYADVVYLEGAAMHLDNWPFSHTAPLGCLVLLLRGAPGLLEQSALFSSFWRGAMLYSALQIIPETSVAVPHISAALPSLLQNGGL
jgi:hypothetical protein